MAKVTYVLSDGKQHEAEVMDGLSVMVGATLNNVPGIDADCGGTLSCATCHIYVDPAWAGRFSEPDIAEQALLEAVAADRRTTSRLSCQLTVTNDLDGLIVEVPDRQF
jgi:2Fe-2S ferredoxin